ncbi:MAG: 7-cyano-7-deazaguanine synthase QueC [bacterium]
MKAVCLVSGGLDSTTCLAIAREEGRKIYALSVQYGQRHSSEIDAAKRAASFFGVAEHCILSMDMGRIAGSSLTDPSLDVPTTPVDIPDDTGKSRIPSTYVPARNLILLSLAVAWAETIGAREVFIGVNALDYSGYPDCRPAFLEAFERAALLGTKAGLVENWGIRIRAPLLYMSKAEIIRTGVRLGVDYGITSSCYQPDAAGHPCGRCHSCQLRLKGFKEAGIIDPLRYQGT